VHALFALAKALEDEGAYAESFRCYEQGNALKRTESHYGPQIIENNTRRQIEVCTREFFAARAGWGAPDPAPIFIVGLPRSGSTLLEQILASHSQVEGTQELPNVQQIVATLRGRDPDPGNPRYPRILNELDSDEIRALGERYLAEAQAYRTARPFFIDKMPNNFRHIGLIRLMLPNAKIIDARREPMACCFSNLKQLFANGQEFTYSVDDIARYYRTYLELMRHWDRVLPGWVLRVQHEDVVDDLEGSVRRILSSHSASNFTRPCAAYAPPVPNRCASPSIATASSNGVISSPGLGPCGPPWAMRSTATGTDAVGSKARSERAVFLRQRPQVQTLSWRPAGLRCDVAPDRESAADRRAAVTAGPGSSRRGGGTGVGGGQGLPECRDAVEDSRRGDAASGQGRFAGTAASRATHAGGCRGAAHPR
jgi:hypothetical protein